MASFRLGTLGSEHRDRIASILVSAGSFSDEEIDVALELFDHRSSSYELIGAFDDSLLLGYACYGPTPATDGTWDLYWLAVHADAQGQGIGQALARWVTEELGRRGARLLVAETSSRADYESTRSFYARSGYAEAARIRDFYAPGDDRLILMTRLSGEAGVVTR